MRNGWTTPAGLFTAWPATAVRSMDEAWLATTTGSRPSKAELRVPRMIWPIPAGRGGGGAPKACQQASQYPARAPPVRAGAAWMPLSQVLPGKPPGRPAPLAKARRATSTGIWASPPWLSAMKPAREVMKRPRSAISARDRMVVWAAEAMRSFITLAYPDRRMVGPWVTFARMDSR